MLRKAERAIRQGGISRGRIAWGKLSMASKSLFFSIKEDTEMPIPFIVAAMTTVAGAGAAVAAANAGNASNNNKKRDKEEAEMNKDTDKNVSKKD